MRSNESTSISSLEVRILHLSFSNSECASIPIAFQKFDISTNIEQIDVQIHSSDAVGLVLANVTLKFCFIAQGRDCPREVMTRPFIMRFTI
jgi:hypothetical protein